MRYPPFLVKTPDQRGGYEPRAVWLRRWNCDFSKVGRCPLRRINELEVAVLQVLQYNVRVASSLFAR